eukprot:250396-Prymnesium_polylepis.1
MMPITIVLPLVHSPAAKVRVLRQRAILQLSERHCADARHLACPPSSKSPPTSTRLLPHVHVHVHVKAHSRER